MGLSFLRKELEKGWKEPHLLCSLIPKTEKHYIARGFPGSCCERPCSEFPEGTTISSNVQSLVQGLTYTRYGYE